MHPLGDRKSDYHCLLSQDRNIVSRLYFFANLISSPPQSHIADSAPIYRQIKKNKEEIGHLLEINPPLRNKVLNEFLSSIDGHSHNLTWEAISSSTFTSGEYEITTQGKCKKGGQNLKEISIEWGAVGDVTLRW